MKINKSTFFVFIHLFLSSWFFFRNFILNHLVISFQIALSLPFNHNDLSHFDESKNHTTDNSVSECRTRTSFLFLVPKLTIYIPLMAKTPPVMKPETIGFMWSSLFLMWTRRQSNEENMPAHKAKLPMLIQKKYTLTIYLQGLDLFSLSVEHHQRIFLFWESWRSL